MTVRSTSGIIITILSGFPIKILKILKLLFSESLTTCSTLEFIVDEEGQAHPTPSLR